MRSSHQRELGRKLTMHHSTGSAPVEAGGGEELWIIAKDAEAPSANPTSTTEAQRLPYLGLIGEREGPSDTFTPARTAIDAVIAGPVATVTIGQRYRNPFGHSIEVEYVFPLPPNAAVGDFLMTIGTRRIRGLIRERHEAQRIYAEASNAGHIASLLTQERPNSFTQAVGNLGAGQQIELETTYYTTLRFDGGEYELTLPTAAAPVHDPQSAVPELRVAVDVDAGVDIASIHSPSHPIVVQRPAADRAHVELQGDDQTAARDFVLRYAAAGKEVQAALLAHHDQRGGFFLLMLQPPADAYPPSLSDITVDWGALAVSDVNPTPIPDLPGDQPLVLTGRFHNAAPATIRISAESAGDQHSYLVPVAVADLAETHPALVSLWARAQIAALDSAGGAAAATLERDKEITDLALEYGLVSPTTGILAVDAAAPANAGR